MKNLILFSVVAAIQLYIPARMILGHEKIINEGEEYKFLVAPIDPSDPFRGKYIHLNFEAADFTLKDTTQEWKINEEVYVQLKKDSEGYAAISNVTKEAPEGLPYVKATIRHKLPYEKPEKLQIAYPFDRFYMEESKAYDAELAYRESLDDTLKKAYALVFIKDGEAVLTDVMINDMPILKLLEDTP